MAGKLQLNRCSRLIPIALLLLLALSGDGTDTIENDGPRFSIEPDELIEFSNSTGIRVNCSATGNPKPRITWMFSDGSAVSNISGLRQIEADGTLVFYPFRAEDFRQDVHAVVYRCLAFNFYGVIVSRDVHVKADNDPDAVKPVAVVNEITFLNNGSVLVSQVNVNHQGYYFCFASNGISGEISRTTQLKEQTPVVFREKQLIYKFRAGESGILRCEAFGDSPILFSWFCNETTVDKLPSSHRFKQKISIGGIRESVINELYIESLERFDSGIYTCKAENSLGSDTLLAKVVIEDRPAVPEIQTIINKGNKTVEIYWNKPCDGNNLVIHYILEYKRKQDSWPGRLLTFDSSLKSTSVRGLQAGTAYEFRLATENNNGRSDFSPVVSIVTGEEAPEGPPQHVKIDSTDSQSLIISWKPPKKNLWNGIIRGYYIGYKVYKSSESYKFISLDVPEYYGDDINYHLTKLKQFTQYSIIVQAYNDGGRGPFSEEIVIMTSEGVPSEPPSNIYCISLSPRNVYVIWDPPSPESTNGIIRGYKVFYKLLKDWYIGDTEMQIRDTRRAVLHGLSVNTNYSIQVVAFTKMGDGVKSQPIICKTDEDVPEAPETIKVLPSSTDSVLVSWKPPKKPNGVITKYNVYYKPITDEELNRDTGNEKSNIKMHSQTSDFMFFEVKGLQKNTRYAFWVTATSSIGEGPKSKIVTRATVGEIVPAKSASFNDIIKTPWKRDVEMPCKAVGQPQPQTRWISRGKTVTENERVLVRFDGSLVIKRINQEDTGNYSCRIINQYGSDEVHYSVTVIVPPGSPSLEVLSESKTSVHLRWRSATDGGDPIKGYILYYKRDAGEWDKIELASDTETYTLENLSCGVIYRLYIHAFNSVGTGVPSDIVTVKTKGDAFNTPQKNRFISESSTYATVNLDAWSSNDCPIAYFAVEYRKKASQEWILVSDHIPASQRTIMISGLNPASWYVLRITVHTSADDFNIAEYIFSTLTLPREVQVNTMDPTEDNVF